MRSRDDSIIRRVPNATALVVANSAHAILFATPNGRAWLRRFFGTSHDENRLPRRIGRWLEAGPAAPPEGVTARRAGSSLLVRRYAPQPSECVALSLELISDDNSRSAPGGLSRRQRDVLRLVASGKSNKAIAAVLNIAPKTVGKHVEIVFRKLGVTNRIAAVNAYTGYVGERD